MATEIKMPQLSDTMSSGKILVWKKREGEQVSRGDILAEVETDKANLEIEAFFPGTLLKIMTPAGTAANVGDVIAVIGAAGEQYAGSTTTSGSIATPLASTTMASATATPPTPVPLTVVAGSAATSSTPASAPSVAVASHQSDRLRASPLAKKVAEQLQVNLSAIQGSGPHGRIVKKDVEAAATTSTAGTPAVAMVSSSNAVGIPSSCSVQSKSEQTAPSVPAPIPATGRLTPFSKMRETIARRMQESVVTAPHFYVTTTINMGQALKLREILKERPDFKGISVNHLVIKAVAYGLSLEPRVNNTVRDGQLFEPGQINVGIIMALNDGLIIPVLKEADKLSLKDTVFEARALVDRARAGRPTSSDLSGGTFSISNMGMYDVENFTAIINPGQGGILAVSAVKQEPVVEANNIVIGSVMKVTVSVDHRIIDGVMASTFLSHVKTALETPALLMT